MISTFGIAVFVLFILVLFVRRAFSPKRHKEHHDLQSYLLSHELAAQLKMHAMREETSRFGALEAMGPVEAGLREILELHGNPGTLRLEREGDTLLLISAESTVAIAWVLRSTTLAMRGKSRNVHGNGHWEVTINQEFPELFSELAPLMGYVSSVVRTMINEESPGIE